MRKSAPMQFANIDGRPEPVAAYIHVPVGERPRATCVVCDRAVSLKAGLVLVPHAAHKSDVRCASSNGETARHANAKAHLIKVLTEAMKGCHKLIIDVRCAGAPGPDGRVEACDRRQLITAAWGWTVVFGAKRLGRNKTRGYRNPDAGVGCGKTDMLFFECHATHQVDLFKSRDYAALGIPVLEIEAFEAFYSGATPWSADQELRVERTLPSHFAWRCGDHKAAYRAHCEQIIGVTGPLFKVVDIHPRGEEHWRSVFRIDAFIDGPDHRVRWRVHRDDELVADFDATSWLVAVDRVNSEVERDLGLHGRANGAAVYVPKNWQTYSEIGPFSPAYLYSKYLVPPRRPE